jgi:hypothetical protein
MRLCGSGPLLQHHVLQCLLYSSNPGPWFVIVLVLLTSTNAPILPGPQKDDLLASRAFPTCIQSIHRETTAIAVTTYLHTYLLL